MGCNDKIRPYLESWWIQTWTNNDMTPGNDTVRWAIFKVLANDITTDIDWPRDKAVCWRRRLLSRTQKYRVHCETSGGYRSSWLLGKEMGHGIPTSQMQYRADYKETDKKDQCFL